MVFARIVRTGIYKIYGINRVVTAWLAFLDLWLNEHN